MPPRLWDSGFTLLPSSPVTIKQALKEDHDRGFPEGDQPRKKALPLSPNLGPALPVELKYKGVNLSFI